MGRPYLWVIGMEEERHTNGTERIFYIVIMENFLTLEKERPILVQEAQQIGRKEVLMSCYVSNIKHICITIFKHILYTQRKCPRSYK